MICVKTSENRDSLGCLTETLSHECCRNYKTLMIDDLINESLSVGDQNQMIGDIFVALIGLQLS